MLSESKLKSFHRKPQQKQIVLTDRDGLYVRVSKVGGVSFFIRYRYAGKAEQLSIGQYPAMSLKEARGRNEHYRAILNDGKNPKIQKKLELKENHEAMTFGQLVELWYEVEAKPKKKNHLAVFRVIKNHLFPAFEDVPIKEITTHHFFYEFDKVVKRSPHQLKTLISNVRQAYTMAIRRRLLDENPLIGISANKDFNVKQIDCDRSLDDFEVERLLKYAFDSRNARTGAIIFLALFYGCRMSELRLAKIEHFDFFNMTWTVPNHKTIGSKKKPIIRPIIKELTPIIEILIGLSSDRESLLTSRKTGTAYTSEFWTNYPNLVNSWLRRNDFKEINHWTMHDLRRTQRTNMASIAEPHICEIMLGHKLPGVWQVYDKHLYLDEQDRFI
ncbi:integrase family protein [Vibrio harveyi]|uniref:tyrosine-type recombinase/integrase n=1 Tax=Vibrio harveyi TaxID=669 RepID=UPI00237F901A|nr:integrase family protein [Vibrio harveyi]HDM8068674.1 integrase arm-type DNA-binding domain-containing protein [Vibrio harveyi]